MGQDYKRLNHFVSLINFHFVWIPKRRKKILVGQIAERLDALLHEKSKDLGLEIIALEIQSDHMHLFVSTAGNVSSETVRRYIEGQSTR